MEPDRAAAGREAEVVKWTADTELDEAGWIAQLVLDLIDEGVEPRNIAVLVRGRASYPRLVEQFATFAIPVQPGGRSGLFDQPEARVLGRAIAWLRRSWLCAVARSIGLSQLLRRLRRRSAGRL